MVDELLVVGKDLAQRQVQIQEGITNSCRHVRKPRSPPFQTFADSSRRFSGFYLVGKKPPILTCGFFFTLHVVKVRWYYNTYFWCSPNVWCRQVQQSEVRVDEMKSSCRSGYRVSGLFLYRVSGLFLYRVSNYFKFSLKLEVFVLKM